MIKHIRDAYQRIRYHYDQITQPPAPVEPNNGIRTGTTNNSLLGGLFAKTHISATAVTTTPRADTVTEAWYNVGKHMREAMETYRKELDSPTDEHPLLRAIAKVEEYERQQNGAPAPLSSFLRGEFAEIAEYDTPKRKSAKKLLVAIIKEELFVHTPKWANMILFSFHNDKVVVAARDGYRGYELSLLQWLKPATIESLRMNSYFFHDADFNDLYFFFLNELYPNYAQEYDDEPTEYFSADGGAE